MRSYFLVTCLPLLCLPHQAVAQAVGNVAAVNPATQGTAPGGAARALGVGAPIVNRERIVTAGEGNAQIVFTASSTMSIGRNSAVTIDRYVFNAGAGAGEQAISVGKGVLRFVGGGVSHGAGATIRSPVATVGIRGGVATIAVGGECGLLAMNQFGVLSVSNAINRVAITRSGYGVCVNSPNLPIPEAKPISAETFSRLMAQIGSGPGQTGGSRSPPTNAQAQQVLGDRRPPNNPGRPAGTPGLDSLDLPRTGNSIVQSGAEGRNQPQPQPEIFIVCPSCD